MFVSKTIKRIKMNKIALVMLLVGFAFGVENIAPFPDISKVECEGMGAQYREREGFSICNMKESQLRSYVTSKNYQARVKRGTHYGASRDFCAKWGGNPDGPKGQCTNMSVNLGAYIKALSVARDEIMERISSKDVFVQRKSEGRVYANVAMYAPLTASGLDNSYAGYSAEVKFSFFEGFVNSDSKGIVNYIQLKTPAMKSLTEEVRDKVFKSFAKYKFVESKNVEHSANMGLSKKVVYDTTLTHYYKNKGDEITIEEKPYEHNGVMKYALTIKYTAKELIEQQEAHKRMEEVKRNQKEQKAESELEGL